MQADKDNNGTLDVAELRSLIRRVWTDTTNHYYSHTEYQVLGFICNPKTALSQVMKVSPMELSDEMIYELFAAMDADDSGTLTMDELFSFLSPEGKLPDNDEAKGPEGAHHDGTNHTSISTPLQRKTCVHTCTIPREYTHTQAHRQGRGDGGR